MATDPSTIARWTDSNRQEWAIPNVVRWWDAWHSEWSDTVWESTDVLVAHVGPILGRRVLDLASGPGEPAITLAHLVGPEGTVVATDVSPGMIESAERNARQAGLTNFTARVAAAEALPFRNGEFDLVSCRFGIIYFPDVGGALAEARRVLKPGDMAVFVVWGPMETNAFRELYEVIPRYVPMPEPEAGAPALDRFADGILLSEAMRDNGFEHLEVGSTPIDFVWQGTLASFDDYIFDLLRGLLDAIPAERHQDFEEELQSASRTLVRDGRLRRTGPVIVVSGQAP